MLTEIADWWPAVLVSGFCQRGLRRRGTTLNGETCTHRLQSFGFGYATHLLYVDWRREPHGPRQLTATEVGRILGTPGLT
jgi:hypothetical protein